MRERAPVRFVASSNKWHTYDFVRRDLEVAACAFFNALTSYYTIPCSSCRVSHYHQLMCTIPPCVLGCERSVPNSNKGRSSCRYRSGARQQPRTVQAPESRKAKAKLHLVSFRPEPSAYTPTQGARWGYEIAEDERTTSKPSPTLSRVCFTQASLPTAKQKHSPASDANQVANQGPSNPDDPAKTSLLQLPFQTLPILQATGTPLQVQGFSRPAASSSGLGPPRVARPQNE